MTDERLNEIKEYIDFHLELGKQLIMDEDTIIEKELYNYIILLKKRIDYLERSNNRREDEIKYLRQEVIDIEDCREKNIKALEHLKLKQIRFLNEKDYTITDLDLDDIMKDLD